MYEVTVLFEGQRPAGHLNQPTPVTYSIPPARFASLDDAKQARAALRMRHPSAEITIVDHTGRIPVDVDHQPAPRERAPERIAGLRAELARAGGTPTPATEQRAWPAA